MRGKKASAIVAAVLIMLAVIMTAGCGKLNTGGGANGSEHGADSEQGYCTVSIVCGTLVERGGISAQLREIIPENGIILEETEVEVSDGMSVFDVLLTVTRDNDIHMEFVETPIYGSKYIEGIANIYEFDGGELSGWMYAVNGEFPNVGCSSKEAAPGDVIEWIYTCDLGRDIGADDIKQASE